MSTSSATVFWQLQAWQPSDTREIGGVMDGTQFAEQVVVVAGIVLSAGFVICLMLLFLFTRAPRQWQLRVAARAQRLEHAMQAVLDRDTGAFAVVVVSAMFGVFVLSVILLFIRQR